MSAEIQCWLFVILLKKNSEIEKKKKKRTTLVVFSFHHIIWALGVKCVTSSMPVLR